jgi:hypothetical protein
LLRAALLFHSSSFSPISDLSLSCNNTSFSFFGIGIIAAAFSKRLEIAPVRALQLFYESKTCADLHDKETGLYLYGNLYIADEFIREYQNKL